MESATPTTKHAHHWRIDEPDGPHSRGVCRVCGAEKLFKNWLEGQDFLTRAEHQQAA